MKGRSLWIIAGISAVMLVGMFAATRPRVVLQDRIARPGGPSAIEESGQHGVRGTGLGVRQPTRLEPRTPNPKHRSIKRTRRAERSPVKRMTDVPRAREETREKAIPGTGTTGDRNHSASQESFSLPEATAPPVDQPVPAPVVSAVPPAAPPVKPILTPPVLLTAPSAGDGLGGYHLTLERGNLAPQLRAQALEGRVVLRILVLANGNVDRTEIASTSGQSMLDQAAIMAAQSWRFDPATRDGIPIDAWVLIPVRFVIR